jgi:hypothetical protein
MRHLLKAALILVRKLDARAEPFPLMRFDTASGPNLAGLQVDLICRDRRIA